MKQTLYIDMDGVLVNIEAAILKKYGPGNTAALTNIGEILDQDPSVFRDAPPMEGAVEAFEQLSKLYNVFILSTAPWSNPESWMIKRLWVEEHLGKNAFKRLILTHHKELMIGNYLIDDRTNNGAGEFKGEHILFGNEQYPNWNSILTHLR
jgi:5'(3')-deoxyribonucleotidase